MYNIYMLYRVHKTAGDWVRTTDNTLLTFLVGIYTSMEKAKECIDNYNEIIEKYKGFNSAENDYEFRIREVDFESVFESKQLADRHIKYIGHSIIRNSKFTHLDADGNPHKYLRIFNGLDNNGGFTDTIIIFGISQDNGIVYSSNRYDNIPAIKGYDFDIDSIDDTTWMYFVSGNTWGVYDISFIIRKPNMPSMENTVQLFNSDEYGFSSIACKGITDPKEVVEQIEKQFFDKYGVTMKEYKAGCA